MKVLKASDLYEAIFKRILQGGDFDIVVYDKDTETQHFVTSLTLEHDENERGSWAEMILMINETPREANQGEPDWAIDPELEPSYDEQDPMYVRRDREESEHLKREREEDERRAEQRLESQGKEV